MSLYGVFWRDRFDDLRALLKDIDPPKPASPKAAPEEPTS